YLKWRPYRTLSYCVAIACYLKYRPYRTQTFVVVCFLSEISSLQDSRHCADLGLLSEMASLQDS
ncbi:MAG: hypothetical protein LHW51_06760, partial [Candidatus Cloacimonetes bacterium]|nr:hypothetical protein [Candidatus Cloacimonadota bacterium]